MSGWWVNLLNPRQVVAADHYVATVSKGCPEPESVAQLISAAPDLLEALEKALEFGRPSCPRGVDEWENARAAITKAKGV